MRTYTISQSFFIEERGGKRSEYSTIEGIVTGVKFILDSTQAEMPVFANIFLLDSFGEFTLTLKVDSGYFRSFCNLLKNCKDQDAISISLQYKKSDSGKIQTGCIISQNFVVVSPFYSKKDLDSPSCELPKAQKQEYNGVLRTNYNLQNQFWVDWLREKFKSTISTSGNTSNQLESAKTDENGISESPTVTSNNRYWVIFALAGFMAVILFFVLRNGKKQSTDEIYSTLSTYPTVDTTSTALDVLSSSGASQDVTSVLNRLIDLSKSNSFVGACKVGAVNGNSRLDFLDLSRTAIRVSYSVLNSSAVEVGTLTNLTLSAGGLYGTSTIIGRWVNQDASSGSGNFQLSVMGENAPRCLFMGIVGDGNWSYYVNIQLSESDFQSAIEILGGQYTSYSSSISEADLNVKKDEMLNLMNSYFRDFATNSFDVSNYFAENILTYINYSNLSRDELQQLISGASDYTETQAFIDPQTVEFVRNEGDDIFWKFECDFSCYRPSKSKYQNCRLTLEVGLNLYNQIFSYREIKYTNLTLTESRGVPNY